MGHIKFPTLLLKKWSKAESVILATVVSGEEDLDPEVSTKGKPDFFFNFSILTGIGVNLRSFDILLKD